MSVEFKSQSELDIGGRETCWDLVGVGPKGVLGLRHLGQGLTIHKLSSPGPKPLSQNLRMMPWHQCTIDNVNIQPFNH